jgi:hypothetical protein
VEHKTEFPENLPEDLGNLRYDALTKFLEALSEKLTKDGDKDEARGRTQLAMALKTAGQAIHGAAGWIDVAWKISKPYMEGKNDKPHVDDPPL